MPYTHSGRACTVRHRLTIPGGGPVARRFRADPHRTLDANLAVLASYIRPEDVLLDVGGGAGRIALPLALRRREVITVDASPGMGVEFAAAAAEAGILNARFVHANWLEAEGLQGDVALTANVTYSVRDIVHFITKLVSAARRRVMITVWSVANPNQNAALFHLVYGEEPVALPGYRELLPVLWELDILPDVHVLPGMPPGAGRAHGSPDSADAGCCHAVGAAGAVVGAARPCTRAPSHRRTLLRAVCAKSRGLSSPLASGSARGADHLGDGPEARMSASLPRRAK